MKTFDLNNYSVTELGNTMLIGVNGGDSQPLPVPVSPWWSVAAQLIYGAIIVLESAAKNYIKYSEETGGQYVIHHAI
jgi:hypothetical protein